MKHFCFFLLLSICTLYPEGFVGNTQVKIKTGYRSIEYVHQDTVICSYDFAKKRQQKSKVRQTYRSRVPYYIRLFFDDRSVGVAPDQKLYVEALNKWVCAESIVTTSFLQDLCQRQMGLVHAVYIFEPIDVYIFTLKSYHTFYVTEKNIIAHNFDLSFASAIPMVTMAAPMGESFLNAMQTGNPWIIAGAGLVIGGYCLYNLIFSKQKDKKEAKLVRRKLESERQRMLEEEQRNAKQKCGSRCVDSCCNSSVANNSQPPRGGCTPEELAWRKKNAEKLADELKFKPVRNKFFHGEKVFRNKKGMQITIDNTCHKGGFWKVFDRNDERVGTFSIDLQIQVGE